MPDNHYFFWRYRPNHVSRRKLSELCLDGIHVQEIFTLCNMENRREAMTSCSLLTWAFPCFRRPPSPVKPKPHVTYLAQVAQLEVCRNHYLADLFSMFQHLGRTKVMQTDEKTVSSCLWTQSTALYFQEMFVLQSHGVSSSGALQHDPEGWYNGNRSVVSFFPASLVSMIAKLTAQSMACSESNLKHRQHPNVVDEISPLNFGLCAILCTYI